METGCWGEVPEMYPEVGGCTGYAPELWVARPTVWREGAILMSIGWEWVWDDGGKGTRGGWGSKEGRGSPPEVGRSGGGCGWVGAERTRGRVPSGRRGAEENGAKPRAGWSSMVGVGAKGSVGYEGRSPSIIVWREGGREGGGEGLIYETRHESVSQLITMLQEQTHNSSTTVVHRES